LFNIRYVSLAVGTGDFEANGLVELPLERRDVTVRRPQLQLGVAAGAQPRQVVVATRKQIDCGKRLRVAAIEPLRQPHDGRQDAYRRAQRPVQVAVTVVRFLRGRLTVIARHERDDLDLLRLESAQPTILDQIVGMTMVSIVADVHADVVEQGGILEPFALAVAEAVDAACLVEDAVGEPRLMLRVFRPVASALG
jgi:hypothetical protein